MKKTFLLTLSLCALLLNINAQNCTPDPDLPPDFLGVWPITEVVEPCDSIVPEDPAIPGTPYEFTFTVFTPDEFDFNGFPVALDNVTVVEVNGLPDGLSYVCEPTDCIFIGGQGGCMKIEGTTTAPNGVYDIEIVAQVNASLVGSPIDPIDITFPPDPDNNLLDLPTCPYRIQVGTTSNQDLFNAQISIGQNTPNPFSGMTTIPVNAETGDYNFAVYNTIGELVHSKDINISGNQNVEFDASNLDAGIYFYTFSNENGKITRRMIVQ